MDTHTSNSWVEQHEPDPRLPTSPDYVELEALSAQYGVPSSAILQLALDRPGACLQTDGNPWVDHGRNDETLYFHEPTLQAAISTKSL